MLITILATAVVLGVLIFVHELGHFMTAKACDIEVPKFSIGFGPKILGFKRGETEYVLSLLPLGGYVKMAGTEDMEVIEGEGAATLADTGIDETSAERKVGPRDFDAKSLPARALVISAGVIMNLLFAFVVYTIIGAVWGVPADPGTAIGGVAEEYLTEGAMPLSAITPGTRVTAVNSKKVESRKQLNIALATERAGPAQLHLENSQPIAFELPKADSSREKLIAALDNYAPASAVIARVAKDDVAEKSGIKPGDNIVQAGGQTITDWSQLVSAIETNAGTPLALVVDRGGQQIPITVTPRADERFGRKYGRIGIEHAAPVQPVVQAGLGGAIANGARETWETVAMTADFLVGMFTGRMSPTNMGGPIMIGQLSGEVARLGLRAFLGFMALLSVNLAVLNMLPIPVLDGGHLVFLAIEGLRGGKPLSMPTRMKLTQVGFVMIMALMVWAIGNDLWRVLSKYIGS